MAALSVSNGFAAVLVGLVAVELYFALQSPNAGAPAQIDVRAVSAKISDFGYPPQSAISAWRAGALARPLFAPSRRPPAAPPQALAARIEISRLSGIMITATEKIAVFSPVMGSPLIVTTNSRFGPFAVLSITADSVTVTGPDGVIVMRPDIGDHGGELVASTPVMTILPGGIDVYLVKIPLGSVKTKWFFGSHPV